MVLQPVGQECNQTESISVQKLDRQSRKQIRLERRLARKQARARSENAGKIISILGFSFSLLNVLWLLKSLIAVPVIIPFLGITLFILGLTFSVIAIVKVKQGQIDKSLAWMPITGLILNGLVVLFYLFVIIIVALAFG